MTDIHIGVTVPQIKRTWEQSRTAASEFEAMGYDSLWVCDHLYGPQSPSIPILEAWSLLSASRNPSLRTRWRRCGSVPRCA